MVGRTAAPIALAVAALAALPAAGQPLAQLTVESFVLSSDTAHPHADVPFHLIVTLRVRERIDRVTNLELPMLADLELLGDERQTIGGSRGSQYRESLTVAAHSVGRIAVAPATLQAIDGRDGRPKQWYSNGLMLQVIGANAQRFRPQARLLVDWIVGLACLALVLVLILRQRRAPPLPPQKPVRAPPPPAFPPVVRTLRSQLADALTVLRAERTRGSAVRVRAAVWRMLGASEGETLGDLLRHTSPDDSMREVLIALERSAFTYDEDLRAAIDDACSALERQIGSFT